MSFKVVKRYGGQQGWVLKQYRDGRPHYVAESAWPAGLRKDMTLEQARRYIKTLNASTRVVGEEAARLRATERLVAREAVQHALLPDDAVQVYERNNILFLAPGDPTHIKRENIWQSAKELVAALGMHPSDWSQSPEPLYLYAKKQRWSWDYFKRVTSALNKYGRVYCRTYNAYFEPVELTDQRRKIEIELAFGDGRESAPLQVRTLQALKTEISDEHFGWLWVCFWFGLRPHETDMLRSKKTKDGMRTWWTEDNDQTLVVYQPKLTKVKPAKRYKRIPIELPEQREALALLENGKFKRPTDKQAMKWLPVGVSLYGCRHGFAVFMDQRGVDIYALSRWLGHQSVTTTERYYVRLGLRREAA